MSGDRILFTWWHSLRYIFSVEILHNIIANWCATASSRQLAGSNWTQAPVYFCYFFLHLFHCYCYCFIVFVIVLLLLLLFYCYRVRLFTIGVWPPAGRQQLKSGRTNPASSPLPCPLVTFLKQCFGILFFGTLNLLSHFFMVHFLGHFFLQKFWGYFFLRTNPASSTLPCHLSLSHLQIGLRRPWHCLQTSDHSYPIKSYCFLALVTLLRVALEDLGIVNGLLDFIQIPNYILVVTC